MAKREEFRLDLTANDQASAKIDEVAAKAEGLSSAGEVEITATDEATEKIDDVAENVEELDGTEAETELSADDAASEVIGEVGEAVEDLDEATAEPVLTADDQASADIETVAEDVSDLDGYFAEVTLEAEDNASEDIDAVLSSAESVDDTFTATIESEGAAEAEGSTGGIVENLGSIVGGKGLAALSAGGLFAIAEKAADAALEVQGIADATGGTLDQTSRLLEVWGFVGGSPDALEKNIIRANDRLRESPELADQLGIQITENMSPMEVFIAAVEALNSGQLTVPQRLALATEVFGSKGTLIINDLQSQVGDLSEAMAQIADHEITTPEDVENARELKAGIDDVEDVMASIARDILPVVAASVENIGALLGSWPMQKLIDGFEVLGTHVSPMEILFSAAGGNAGEVIGAIEDTTDALEGLLGLTREDITGPLVFAWEELMADLADNGEIDSATGALEMLAEASGKSEDEVVRLATGQGEAQKATEENEAAIDDQVEALEEQRDEIEANTEALEGYIDAQRDAFDQSIDLREAQEDTADATADYTAALEENGEGSNEARDAGQDLIGAVLDEADAFVQAQAAIALANGETLDGVESIDAFNASLATSATTIPDELIPQLVNMAMKINDIPAEYATEVSAAIQSGDVTLINETLTRLSRTRTAAVKVNNNEVIMAQVELALNNLARTRTVNITTRGGGVGGRQAIATGTSYSHRGVALVGEEGPELVSLPAGAQVLNAGQSAEMMRAGVASAMYVYNITQNIPAGTRPADVARALRRQERIQGPA